MELSREAEAELIERNMPKICNAVNNFRARCSNPVVNIPFEDFVQEVTIAYLEYIRRCETMAETEIFPWYNAVDAMSRLVLAHQPMGCPKRHASFETVMKMMPSTISYEVNAQNVIETDGMSRTWVNDENTLIDLGMFMETLPENAEKIIGMKLWGLTSREIASELGVSESAVCQSLKNYRKKYNQFRS